MITLRQATLETVKPLRLRALREDPDAFASTLAREEHRPDADWHFWVDDSLIAFEGETPVGMANLKIDDERTEIFGMWVAPQARGKGVAELLLRELIERAGDRPVRVVVAEPATAARRLYERLGFEPDGTSGELRPGSGIRAYDLIRVPEPARPATRR